MGLSAALLAASAGAQVASEKATARKTAKQAREAEERARKDQEDADKQAREAEVFAETEGKGIGQIGQIQTGINQDIQTSTNKNLRQGKSARKSTLSV